MSLFQLSRKRDIWRRFTKFEWKIAGLYHLCFISIHNGQMNSQILLCSNIVSSKICVRVCTQKKNWYDSGNTTFCKTAVNRWMIYVETSKSNWVQVSMMHFTHLSVSSTGEHSGKAESVFLCIFLEFHSNGNGCAICIQMALIRSLKIEMKNRVTNNKIEFSIDFPLHAQVGERFNKRRQTTVYRLTRKRYTTNVF